MSDKKNIVFKSVEEYNKKFRHSRWKLLSYSKNEVEQFDKKYSTNKKDYLLEGRKWTLIGDRYYEIPKAPRLTWFRNLNTGVKIITSVLLTGGVASAVTIPTLMFTVWNKEKSLKAVEFATCSWDDIAERCNKLENNKITEDKFIKSFTFDGTPATKLDDFIGKERTVKVNNQDHKVRVIGTKHDKDTNDKILALTFEFANLISDSEGNSLAYQWNDTNDLATANHDYTNSTIRYALTGQGNNGGKNNNTILAAQKGQTTWSTTYNDKIILSMLPEDLTNNLKTVKKSVGTTSTYSETQYTDKLFMLSTIEMGFEDGYDKGYGTTYKYYENATAETETIRIKKQVNNSEVYTSCSEIPSGSGQAFQNTVYNYAGYNSAIDDTGYGYYWLRSPYSNLYNRAWRCSRDGLVNGRNVVYGNAYGVAPAFCL